MCLRLYKIKNASPSQMFNNLGWKKKTSHGKNKFNQYLSPNPVLQKVLENKLQAKELHPRKHREQIISNQ